MQEKVFALKAQYDKSVGQKQALIDEAESLQYKLETAQKLVDGLAGERGRWEANIIRFDADLVALTGGAPHAH